MIDAEDYLVLVERAFGGMVDIVSGLGDERANTRPDIPGANSPYALLFHCGSRRPPDRPGAGGEGPLAAFMHVYEELAGHHGQMEVIADVLRSGGSPPG